MNRIILRALNSPILILILTIAVAVQTSLFSSWPLRFFQPDVILLAVIWFGLHREFLEGGVMTLILGEIAEIHSSAPQGIFLMGYMAVYLALRSADKLFVLPTESNMFKITLAGAAIWHLVTISVMGMMTGQRHLWQEMATHIFPSSVMAAVFGLWIYRWLEKFDALTFKHANTENPDEFQIENLGL